MFARFCAEVIRVSRRFASEFSAVWISLSIVQPPYVRMFMIVWVIAADVSSALALA